MRRRRHNQGGFPNIPPRDLRERLHVSLAEAPAFWGAFCNYARELDILQLKREFVYLLLMA